MKRRNDRAGSTAQLTLRAGARGSPIDRGGGRPDQAGLTTRGRFSGGRVCRNWYRASTVTGDCPTFLLRVVGR